MIVLPTAMGLMLAPGARVALAAQVQGNDRNNKIVGTTEGDFIEGRGGDGRIEGCGESDLLRGDSGRDRLLGGSSSDAIQSVHGSRDFVDRGSGPDSAGVDRRNVLKGRETVIRQDRPKTGDAIFPAKARGEKEDRIGVQRDGVNGKPREESQEERAAGRDKEASRRHGRRQSPVQRAAEDLRALRRGVAPARQPGALHCPRRSRGPGIRASRPDEAASATECSLF